MNYRGGILTGIAATLLLVGAAAGGWWLVAGPSGTSSKPAAHTIPADVPKPFKEDKASGVTLTPEAEARLKVGLGVVERKPVVRKREYGGEVSIPPGQAVIVTSPVTGMLKRPAKATPEPGRAVKKGDVVFNLIPILSPDARANLTAAREEVNGLLDTNKKQLEAAEIALKRALSLRREEAGSQRQLDDAQAVFDSSTEAVKGAAARLAYLNKVLGETESGMAIDCPEDGFLRTVSALPGQMVGANAPLFEVVNLDRAWVRVPVYAGDLSAIDPAAAAEVRGLADTARNPGRPAKPVAAPPSANPLTGTVDLFYEILNPDSSLPNWASARKMKGFDSPAYDRPRLSPGERVSVSISLRESAESLTVPWAAVLFDYQGGAWVYEPTGDRTYSRRRVTVRYVVGETAVLDAGPAPGTKVVTAGAAELFGAETGYSK